MSDTRVELCPPCGVAQVLAGRSVDGVEAHECAGAWQRVVVATLTRVECQCPCRRRGTGGNR